MAIILKGAPAANAITEQLTLKAEELRQKGIIPTLAILRVGENESDLAYERAAMKRCEKIGIEVRQILLPAESTTEQVAGELQKINCDSSIHGCLMFRPLPGHIDEAAVCAQLAPEKDVDAMTPASLTHVFTGKGAGFAPCTAQSCIEILDYYGYDPAGKNAAVIGRSLVIGKPVSMMLQSRNATVTMCHTKTKEMASICSRADILVAAAGHAGIVNAAFTNPGQIIIDVGINVDSEGNMSGDVDFASAEPVCAAITPVPGGVGSVTTAVLCKHVIEAAGNAAADI